ncbi:MAG: hypothetical protein AAGB31_04885 [Bdellovibrio sp.]
MAISVLSQASALNPGSDLWIVPDLQSSQWTARLDWYLNFQVCKSSRHIPLQTKMPLNEILAETELSFLHSESASSALSPLMIASEGLLPNKWVVIVPWQSELTPWTSSVFNIWQNLREPTLRIFLPPGQSTGNLQLVWQALHKVQDFTVVLD